MIRNKVLYLLSCLLFGIASTHAQTPKKLVAMFRESTNDSVFLSRYSEFPYQRYRAQMHSSFHPLPTRLDSVAFHSEKGKVVKYLENDTALIYLKVIAIDSAVKLRVGNIWLDPKGITPDSLKKEWAYVLRKAQLGVISFDQLCQSYSGTKGQDQFNCDLGWFYPETMVDKFYMEALERRKGEIYPMETEFGKHIVKTLEDPVKDRWKVTYVLLGIRKH